MRQSRLGLLALAVGVVALAARPAAAQSVGSKVPAELTQALEAFGDTPAKSFEEFAGRAVLIEFFEDW
jgi:hypothetical protein